MFVAESLVFDADIETGITVLGVEYEQRVVAFVGRAGHVEPRPELVLDVASCQHVQLRGSRSVRLPPVHSDSQVCQAGYFHRLTNMSQDLHVGRR